MMDAWANTGRLMKHADLWKEMDVLMQSRLRDAFRMLKVKGHSTLEHVRKGIVTMEDKIGNDQADTLAVARAL